MMGVDAKNEFWQVIVFFSGSNFDQPIKIICSPSWGTNRVRHDCVSTADRMTGNQNLCVSPTNEFLNKKVAFCPCVLVTL